MSLFSRITSPEEERQEVLAVSPDDRFFTSILCATADTNWKVRWVRSVEGACTEMARRPAPVVFYDCHSRLPEWKDAIGYLGAGDSHPSVILGAPEVDETLWTRALASGAYDVIPRAASFDLLTATLDFAWKRRRARRLADSGTETVTQPAARQAT